MNKIIQANETGAASERFFFRIVSTSIALAFGFATASIESLERNAFGLTFHLSAGTLLAFAVGTVAGWLFWKSMSSESKSLHRKGVIFLLLAGATGFLYPLRYLSGDRLGEVAYGLADAAVALSLIGYMIYRVGRFLEADSAEMAATVKETAVRH